MVTEKEYKAKEGQVERLAEAIKFGNLSATRKQLTMTKITSLLLEIVNGKLFSQMQQGESDQLLGTENYDGNAFYKAFTETLTYGYGKIDENTTKRIPFLRLFWNRYQLKLKQARQDAWREQNPENAALRAEHVKTFLKKVARCKGIAEDVIANALQFNMLNYQKGRTFLVSIGAPEYVDAYQDVFDKTYTQSMYTQERETEKTAVSTVYEKQTYEEFAAKEVQLTYVLDLLDEAKTKMLQERQAKILQQYIDLYITIRIFETYGVDAEKMPALQDHIDTTLWAFCCAHYRKKAKLKDILAAYLQIQPDTVRKKISIVQKFLVKVQSEG